VRSTAAAEAVAELGSLDSRAGRFMNIGFVSGGDSRLAALDSEVAGDRPHRLRATIVRGVALALGGSDGSRDSDCSGRRADCTWSIGPSRSVLSESRGWVTRLGCRSLGADLRPESNQSVEPTATALTVEDAMKVHYPASIAASVAHLRR
jgi:hypothetical protein